MTLTNNKRDPSGIEKQKNHAYIDVQGVMQIWS